MDAPLGISQDPAALIRSIMQQFSVAPTEPNFSQFDKHVADLNASATALFSQLQGAMQAPTPTTNPTADFLTRSIAAGADALTGDHRGVQGANAAISADQGSLRERRIQNLQMLMNAHEKAADRAAKAGDALEEAKLRAKIETLHSRVDQLRGAQEGAAALLRSQDSQAQTAAENSRSANSNATQIKVAEIYADARKSGKLDQLKEKDPVAGALFESYLKQAQEIEDRRSQLATKTDNKGRLVVGRDKKADKQLTKLEERKAVLLQQANDVMQAAINPQAQPQATTSARLGDSPRQFSAQGFLNEQAPPSTQQQVTEEDVLTNLITHGYKNYAAVQAALADPQLQNELTARGLSKAKLLLAARKELSQVR